MGKKKKTKKAARRVVVLKPNMQRLMEGIANSQSAAQAQIKALTVKLNRCKSQLISDGRMAKRVVDSLAKPGEKFKSYNGKTGKMVLVRK